MDDDRISGEPKGIIQRDAFGRFIKGNPPGPGWRNRSEETQKLAQLRDDLLAGSEEAIAELRKLLKESKSENVKVNAAKILIVCAKIIPDQVFHESWKMILKKEEKRGETPNPLPEFGKYLQWKMQQDANRVINVTNEEEIQQGEFNHETNHAR